MQTITIVIHIYIYIYIYIYTYIYMGLQNTPTASLHRGKAPQTSALDMRLRNLMLML